MSSQKTFRRIGLARALSKLGYCSRSDGADLVRNGRVRLNGAVCRNPEAPIRFDRDRIEVDGRLVEAAAKVYLVLNKPRGVVTTASDEKNRKTVYAFLEPESANRGLPWVAPVGRLDKASEGLLLLTNDSEWAARVLAPETHLNKTYHVQIGRVADAALLEKLKRGVKSEGDFLRVGSVRILRGGERNTWLEIVLDEGRNRHIRRMLEALEVEVLRLLRVAIGPLELGKLPKGAFRPLTLEEKQAMDVSMEQVSLDRRRGNPKSHA